MKFRSLGFTSSRSIPSQLRFPASVTAEECRTEIGIYFILHPLLNLCTWSASGSRRKKTSNRSTRYSSVKAGLAVRVQIFPTMRKGDTFTITCTYTLCNFTLTAANSPLDEPRVRVSTKVASLNAVLDWKGMPAWGPTQIAIRITVIGLVHFATLYASQNDTARVLRKTGHRKKKIRSTLFSVGHPKMYEEKFST
jgi:hypothetical protein